ncbi:ABC transporter substrate-binding protein [Agromyces soli]
MHSPARSTRTAMIAAALVAPLALSACAGSPSQEQTESDPTAPVVVWTDSTRQPGFEAYAAAHPDVDLEITVYKPAELISKVQLFNASGSGWPDVVFAPAQGADPYYEWAASLDDKIDADTLEGFGTANRPCEFNGKTYCLVNDVSQMVLWYNADLMAQFGYEVPTTWDEYADLGKRVAKEHPGYLIGSAGSSFMYHSFFRAAGCPLQDVTGENEVHIDATDPNCVAVAEMLDELIAAGVVSNLDLWSPELTTLAQEGKVLMHPGASWFGEFVFRPEASWAFGEGTLAAAAYPKWSGADEAYSANAGGGTYIVSKHAANLDAAVDIATWMATSSEYQATAPTYPAYTPVLGEWGERISADPFYAEDPMPVLAEAVDLINPINDYTVRYDVETAFGTVIVPVATSGGSIADALPKLQEELKNLAQSVGYTVVD